MNKQLFLLSLSALLLLEGCASSRRGREPIKPQPIAAQPLPDTRMLIVIDAGHGGEDNGAESLGKPTYQEKELTLATAKLVQKALHKMGYKTMMTRNDDTFIPLKGRAKMANERRAILFVSVHYNSAPSPQAHGIEVFYYRSDEDKSRSQLSKLCASAVLDNVISLTEARSRGVKHGNFAVIRETEMPAILIEGGFVTNKEEMQKIRTPAYMQKLAQGIALGIRQHLHGTPK